MNDFEDRIIEAFRSTRRVGRFDTSSVALESMNQRCGDKVMLFLLQDALGKISDARFEARGCVLSRAAVSIVCEAIIGLDREIAVAWANSMISSVSLKKEDMSMSAELKAGHLLDAQNLINSVLHIPLRIECALLPWRAVAKWHKVEV